MRGPEVTAGTVVEEPESTLDIAPTLLDLAGIDEPEGVQGLSVAGALAGGGLSADRGADRERRRHVSDASSHPYHP